MVEVQRIKLAHEKKTAGRVNLLLRIGKLEGQLGNADQAWEAYTQAFAEDPSSTPARESLEGLANILDNWQPLVALYEKALSTKGKEKLPSALERELLLVVAVAYDEKLGTSGPRGGVLPPRPEHPARGRLGARGAGQLNTRTERWSDLVDTLLKKAQLVADPAERRGDPESAPPREWEMLGNAEQAIVAWNVVLRTTRPTRRRCGALDRLYLARGEYRELADNLQRQLALVADDSPETVGLLVRLGALRELQLDQLGAAVDTYAEVPVSSRSTPKHRRPRADPHRRRPRAGRGAAAGADLQDPAATGRA